MAASPDAVKEAFAARLKKIKEASASSSRLAVTSPPVRPTASPGPLSPAPVASVATEKGIRLEGWLEKQSSGTVRRWQRRYFAVSEGVLAYYKSPGAGEASRKFPLRLAIGVTLGERGEFTILFGNSKIYRLSAGSRGEAVKWVTALESTIATTRSEQEDDFRSDADFDELESVASSSYSRAEASSTGNQRAASSLVPLWELDTDVLDRSFANWFHDDTQLVAATQLVLADLRGQLSGVREVGRVHNVANEYVARLLSALEGVSDSSDLLCVLLDVKTLLVSAETLAGSVSGNAVESFEKRPRRTEETAPWKRQLQEAIDRLASDFEGALVERLRDATQSEAVWELPVVNHHQARGGKTEHGPSVQLLEGVYGERPVFLSSWLPTFASAVARSEVEGRIVRQKHKETSVFVAELVAASLVAAFNNAWRKFRRRAAIFAEKKKTRKQNPETFSLWQRLRASILGSPDSYHAISERWENILSFANECELMSYLCSLKDPEYPEMYVSCLDGLGKCFSSLRDEVARSLVEQELVRKNEYTVLFRRKKIVNEPNYSPMRTILTNYAKNFLNLVEGTAHETVRIKLVTYVMHLSVLLYLLCLSRSDAVLDKTPSLTQTMLQDELAFTEFFTKNYSRFQPEIKSALDPLTRLRTVFGSPVTVKAVNAMADALARAFGRDFTYDVITGLCQVVNLKKDDRSGVLTRLE